MKIRKMRIFTWIFAWLIISLMMVNLGVAWGSFGIEKYSVEEQQENGKATERLNAVWQNILALPAPVSEEVLTDQKLWLCHTREIERHSLSKLIPVEQADHIITEARAQFLEQSFLSSWAPTEKAEQDVPSGRLPLSGDMYLRYNILNMSSKPIVHINIFKMFPGQHDVLVQEVVYGRKSDEDVFWWSSQIEVKDYNLDGWLDFSIPSSAGNVMQFSVVFLYHKDRGKFLRSESMENLPCIDVNISTGVVGGYCFHNNVCENWIEEYTVTGFDTLSKTLAQGTMCGPADADPWYYLTYSTRFQNGVVISHQEEKHFDAE